MRLPSRLITILFLILLAFGLAACSNPNESYIIDREAGALKIGRETDRRVVP